ncbi:hypothetical protein II906_05665 [bacterium]|nr:hypothetical protein [bacterium]
MIISANNNVFSIKNLNNRQNYYSLRKPLKCDTFTFRGDKSETKSMSLYSKCMNSEYTISSPLEEKFDNSVRTFAQVKDTDEPETIRKSSIDFKNAYDDLYIDMLDTDDINDKRIPFVLCDLIEALDNTKSVKASGDINWYLFDSFLPQYVETPSVQNVLKSKVLSDSINKTALKANLQRNIK